MKIQFMWNVKANVMSVIIGSNGTISKSLTHYLSNITGKHECKDIKKQQYGTLHTYCEKCSSKSRKHILRVK
jgi:hypothetical protein